MKLKISKDFKESSKVILFDWKSENHLFKPKICNMHINMLFG